MILSIYDSFVFGEEYGKIQADWLTGVPCLLLGVISTFGSQISLFAMTLLGVIIARKSAKVPGPVNKKSDVRVISLVKVLITAALVISVVPWTPSLEDHFLKG